MNDYVEVEFRVKPYSETATDILAALLADIGYESFIPGESGMSAFVSSAWYDEENLKMILSLFPLENTAVDYNVRLIVGEDWNKEWETNNNTPIIIGDECVIHSTLHTDIPPCRYDIVINPEMAFGTGHHETTALILEEMLKIDFQDKSVLDMGCGTAVLAILAVLRGATPVKAIDIDQWAYKNALENIRLNNTTAIDVVLGGAELLGHETYDIIIANINRNILLKDISAYSRCMHSGSELYMSGFYQEDIPIIRQEAEKNGLQFIHHVERKNWVVVKFIKPLGL